MLEYNDPGGLIVREIAAVYNEMIPQWEFPDDADWIGDIEVPLPDDLYIVSKARNSWGAPVTAMSLTFVFLDGDGLEVVGGTSIATLESFTAQPASIFGLPEGARAIVRESDTAMVNADLSKVVTCKYVAGLPNGLRLSSISGPATARTLKVLAREHRS